MTDQPSGPDRVVARVNDITTTAMDTLACLSIAAGFGLWLAFAAQDPGLGVAAAGVVLMILSSLAQRRAAGPKPKRPTPGDDETIVLPGPSSPGNVHFAGGR
jgi:hypothetical protein